MREKEISKLYNSISNIDSQYIEEAQAKRKNNYPVWVKWAALAACLCFAVTGVLVWQGRPGSGKGSDSGVDGLPAGDGSWPKGVDPVIASIAVYPATEDLRDVADAEVIPLEPDDLGALGTHLPTRLPKGIFLNKASLYRTTMKNGTQYNMLRAGYASEENMVPAPDGSMEYGEDLCVMVYDHPPKIEDREVYTKERLADYLAGQTTEGLNITFFDGDVYLNIVNHQLTPAELIDMIDPSYA